MYHSGLVAVVKVDGKVLRENQETVYIPFGSEYSILIKNLKSQKVLIKVSIDGTDAFDGTQIVIPANSEVELERFIKNGNFSTGNKFKFIERSEAVEEFRGIKSDDGLIRIEYFTEKINPIVVSTNIWIPIDTQYVYPNWLPNNYYSTGYLHSSSTGFKSIDAVDTNYCCNTISTQSVTSPGISINECDLSTTENGITVAGSQSNQKFIQSSWFPVHEQSEVLIIKLSGGTKQIKVVKPLTVKTRKQCTSCGKKSTSDTSFCPKCGTALNLF
jgi:hypothetical protein